MAFALTTEPAAADAITIDRVSKSFSVRGSTVEALRRVSLSIEPGEFVSLLGPSGCGKSTLLRLLAGLDAPEEGTCFSKGAPIEEPSLSRGIVFQDHRLLPWLTVRENVLLSLRATGLAEHAKQARVRELLELVGLSAFAEARPHQLSGGMSQRAAIARALAPRPGVLLLDEPLGALDAMTRSHMQKELLNIWESERLTVVMVTHDIEEALFLSDRIAVMEPRPGRIRTTLEVRASRPRKRSDPSILRLRDDLIAMFEAMGPS